MNRHPTASPKCVDCAKNVAKFHCNGLNNGNDSCNKLLCFNCIRKITHQMHNAIELDEQNEIQVHSEGKMTQDEIKEKAKAAFLRSKKLLKAKKAAQNKESNRTECLEKNTYPKTQKYKCHICNEYFEQYDLEVHFTFFSSLSDT